MALIECKNCGHKISDKASVCPKCGTPTKEEPKENCVQKQESKSNEEIMYLSAVSCLEEGRLEEARDYISGLVAIDPNSTRYQELQEKLDSALQLAREEDEERASKRKRTISTIIGTIILLALIGLCIYYYQKSSTETEQARWEQIKDSEEVADFENYLRQYPDGQYKAEAQVKIHNIQEETSLWNSIYKSNNPAELESFIKKYPKGYFHDMAVTAYDELLWNEATRKNDMDSYQYYMSKCPQGKHYQEAKEKAEYQEKIQLDESEKSNVSSTISQFFHAVARGDEDSMLECLSSELNSFMGRAGATKVDAITYMHKLHADDIYSINVTMGEFEIQKKLDSQNNPVYTADFTFDQRISREDTSKETFASYKGTAMLNNLYRITSLSLSKTAHY